MTWQPLSPDEPAFVPLTDKMMRVRADHSDSGRTPEEILLAREALEDEERRTRRKLSREMTLALVWMQADSPERVQKLIRWTLPIEEAYLLKRYMLLRHMEKSIAEDMGVSIACVSQHIYRALWRLRTVQDLAWDITPEQIREACADVLTEHETRNVVALWECRFNVLRAADTLGLPQPNVHVRIKQIVEKLAGCRGQTARRIHSTIVQVITRRLRIDYPRMKGERRLRMPGGRESA